MYLKAFQKTLDDFLWLELLWQVGIGSLELVLGLWLDKVITLDFHHIWKLIQVKNIQDTAKYIFQLGKSAFCTSSEPPGRELAMNWACVATINERVKLQWVVWLKQSVFALYQYRVPAM